jgi:hypothetical protein
MKTLSLRLIVLFSILSILALAGAIGFMIVEDISFFDALYFTIVTISTVGYGDINPTTTVGKILAIVLVVLGVAIFLGVVANATQLLLQRRQENLRIQRIQMLIGLFFSELGNDLLHICVSFDSQIQQLRQQIIADINSIDDSYTNLKQVLITHNHIIDSDKIDIKKTKNLLTSKGDLVVRLLENPSLHEHESFTELLRVIFHLREELMARDKISDLPDTDIEHLSNDLNRIYPLLSRHWVDYIYYLKNSYSYLYSLAVRTNPFNPIESAIIKE